MLAHAHLHSNVNKILRRMRPWPGLKRSFRRMFVHSIKNFLKSYCIVRDLWNPRRFSIILFYKLKESKQINGKKIFNKINDFISRSFIAVLHISFVFIKFNDSAWFFKKRKKKMRRKKRQETFFFVIENSDIYIAKEREIWRRKKVTPWRIL